jgi:O-acetyl-ADP-ribose deacetylase
VDAPALQAPVGQGLIRILQGDLTLSDAEAIVNAANTHLAHGGGVAAAIVRRGGAQIQRESDRLGHCPEGEAVVTGGGALQARYVIHTVGPRGGDPEGDRKLARAAASSLQRARELGVASLAFPAVSAGIFGYPVERCAHILLDAARGHLREHPEGPLRRIDFVLFDPGTRDAFARAWAAIADG